MPTGAARISAALDLTRKNQAAIATGTVPKDALHAGN
jgi:hypothetical protein